MISRRVAQLAEYLVYTEVVVGSYPTVPILVMSCGRYKIELDLCHKWGAVLKR